MLVRVIDVLGAVLLAAWRVLRPPRDVRTPRKILVVQLDHLGDAILSSPLFPRLRAAFPEARIDVLASPSNQAVFEADPYVDNVRVAERNWFERRPGGWALGSAVWGLGRSLRRDRYELGIDVRGDILSVLVLALAGIPRRVGWAMGGGGFLLTDLARWIPGRHEVGSRLALLEHIGVSTETPARVHTYPTDQDHARVGRLLRDAWPHRTARHAAAKVRVGGDSMAGSRRPFEGRRTFNDEADMLHAGRFGSSAPLLAVHLGAGTLAKRWPVARWKALTARFLEDGWRIVIVGGPEDVEISASLPPHANLRDWAGRLAVTETAALLERADLFIGADSGPAHLAACAGVASVILFSGTNLRRQWRPWSRRSLVLRHRVPCGPCHVKVCPLAGHDCMSGLDTDRVYRASKRWWARLHRRESPHNPL